MRIAVIGAGMAGVAAAQALASEGHEVTVFERRSSVAEETSFAPAGIAAAALAAPWLPGPSRLRATLGGSGEAVSRDLGAAFTAPTLLGKGNAAEAARRAERAAALHALIAAGVERIDDLARALSLDFECTEGLLLTLPDAAAAAQAEVALAWLEQLGGAADQRAEWVDAARQRQIEPGRAVADDASRAVHLPGARVGNTREWTQLLRAHAQHLGVRFLFQHEVAGVSAGPRPAVRFAAVARAGSAEAGIDSSPREERFDAVVVNAALDATRVLAPLGVKLPWRPTRGWSVTVPQNVREAAPDSGPRAALMDVRSGIAITRLGTRVRVAGGHESVSAPAAGDAAEPPSPRLLRPLYDALDASFPGAVHWQQAQAWQATRAALPDGLPAVGASGIPGVWLNVGHAHHGWALSQVAAEALCTMIAGHPSPIDIGALAPQRLR